jgi:hypothetical protein
LGDVTVTAARGFPAERLLRLRAAEPKQTDMNRRGSDIPWSERYAAHE